MLSLLSNFLIFEGTGQGIQQFDPTKYRRLSYYEIKYCLYNKIAKLIYDKFFAFLNVKQAINLNHRQLEDINT